LPPAAQPPPPANKPGTAGYAVPRPAGTCFVSGRSFEPGEKLFTALRDTPQGLLRVDVAPEHWEAFDKADVLGSWQTTMPRPEARKKLFVDDAVLLDLFERLADATEPPKLNFRFVLGLILMRKRLLAYDGSETRDSQEWWRMKVKGRPDSPPLGLLNPHLGEAQVAEVSGQLDTILNEGA